MKKKVIIFTLLIDDIVALYGALLFALALRPEQGALAVLFRQHVIPFTLLYILWLFVFYINDLYNVRQTIRINFYEKLIRSFVINISLAIIFFYFIPYFSIAPRRNLALISIIGFIFISILRTISYLVLTRKKQRTLFMLSSDKTASDSFARYLRDHNDHSTLIVFSSLEEMKVSLDQNDVPFLIVDSATLRATADTLYTLLYQSIPVYDIATFCEENFQEIPAATIDALWVIANFRTARASLYRIVKRLIDLCAACTLLLITVPLLICVALLVKLTSRGNLFYTQERIGYGGKEFIMYKLRTMVASAEAHGPQWAEPNDPRVTWIGAFARRVRLDEIPQCINIIKGDMSFVGPRPERPVFTQQLENHIPYYHLRHSVKPGLTGWAQINLGYTATVEDSEKKLNYDLYYLKHQSIFFDFIIILRTLKVLIKLIGR